jgi:hypothetical protein
MLHVRLILIERQDLGRAFTASTMLVKAALSCGRLAAIGRCACSSATHVAHLGGLP